MKIVNTLKNHQVLEKKIAFFRWHPVVTGTGFSPRQ